MVAVRSRTAALFLSPLGILLSGCALAVAGGVTLSSFVRYLGLVLQLAGFGTVAWGLTDLRRRFSDRPSLLTTLGQRLRRTREAVAARARRLFRRPSPAVVVGASAADAAVAVDSARVEVAYGVIDYRLDVSERLRVLDARTREIQQRIVALERGALDEAGVRHRADTDEQAARVAADQGLDRKLADLAVGGLTVEWWGVIAFLLGTILSTVPDELAGWLRALG